LGAGLVGRALRGVKPSLASHPLLARTPEEIAEQYPEAVITKAFATFRNFIDAHDLDLATAHRIVIAWLCDSYIDRGSFLKAMSPLQTSIDGMKETI
jgi:hypothetical protein